MSVRVLTRGLFSVWKPRGVTSAEVVKELKSTIIKEYGLFNGRRKQKTLKLGHGGTLDKDAEGVLVIGVGEDCKNLSKYLHGGVKEYIASGRLGQATDTYDATGVVVDTLPYAHVDEAAFHKHIQNFIGHFEQSPPVFSALKCRGERLSDKVRRGVEVSRPQPRPVVVHSITANQLDPPLFTITIKCQSGFYVRSLIHDLGVAMGTAAHMTHLQRISDGPFKSTTSLRQSEWTIESILEYVELSQYKSPGP